MLKASGVAYEGVVTVQGQPYTVNIGANDEKLITGPDGRSVRYRMVSFTSNDVYNLTAGKNQSLTVRVAQGAFSAEYTTSYLYSPGSQDITNLYYLPNFKPGSAITSKVPLNGATLQEDKLYILVESSSSLDKIPRPVLKGAYLPSGLKTVDMVQQ